MVYSDYIIHGQVANGNGGNNGCGIVVKMTSIDLSVFNDIGGNDVVYDNRG